MILKRISKPFKDFYRLSQRSRSSRIISGLVVGVTIWLIGIILSFILSPFVDQNTFGKTFIHDLPGFALVFGLVLLLEIWGLIPHLD